MTPGSYLVPDTAVASDIIRLYLTGSLHLSAISEAFRLIADRQMASGDNKPEPHNLPGPAHALLLSLPQD